MIDYCVELIEKEKFYAFDAKPNGRVYARRPCMAMCQIKTQLEREWLPVGRRGSVARSIALARLKPESWVRFPAAPLSFQLYDISKGYTYGQ